jgi:hypothetical protein
MSESEAPSDTSESRDLLPIDLFLGEDSDADCVDIGLPGEAGAKRKFIAMVDGEGINYPIHKREMTIGRGRTSDIRIASHFISRVHARVIAHDIGTVIEDAGSKNGILVNSERVSRRALRDGDIVSLGGKLDLKFVDTRP